MSDNVLVVHGGGPTAVINSSLYGVLKEAKECGKIGKVYGAMGGSEAILKERFLDLLQFPEEKLKLLLTTPGHGHRFLPVCPGGSGLCGDAGDF